MVVVYLFKRIFTYLLYLMILLIGIPTTYFTVYPQTEYGRQSSGIDRVIEALGFTLTMVLGPVVMFLVYLHKQLRLKYT